MRTTIKITAALGLALLACLPSANAQTDTLYVRQAATGANDGTSWENAFTHLQPGIDSAAAGDEILVSTGVYLPDTAGGSRLSSFFFDKNIVLKGGFAGAGLDPFERSITFFPSILRGDLNLDDLPGDLDSNRSDNVHTVLTIGTSVTNDGILDGFFIQNGHADGDASQFQYQRGGGIFSFGAPILSNCFFHENHAQEGGGGLYFHTSGAEGAKVMNCTFGQNRAKNGGGAMVFSVGEAGLLFDGCEFGSNTATEDGGGLRVYNSNCLLEGCIFYNNQAARNGGGMDVRAIWDDNVTEANGGTFTGNTARNGGGINFQTNSGLGAHNNQLLVNSSNFFGNVAMLADTTQNDNPQGGALRTVIDRTTNGCKAIVMNCLFSANLSTGSSGGIYASLEGQDMTFFLGGSVLTECQAETAGALLIIATDVADGTATIEGCVFAGNSATEGAGAVLLEGRGSADMDFFMVMTQFSDGLATTDGGALSLLIRDTAAIHLSVEKCLFEKSQADRGGALFVERRGGSTCDAHFLQSFFKENAAATGAVFANAPDAGTGSGFTFDNCIFIENTGPGATLSPDSFPALHLLNCTLADNAGPALEVGGNSTLFLQNNIFYNPDNEEITGDFFNATILSHGGNFAEDASFGTYFTTADQTGPSPLFIGSGDHPYQLAPGSPAIDAGVLPVDLPDLDLAGNARVVNCMDAGAYESPVSTGENCVVSGSGLVANEWQFEVFPNPVGEVLQVLFENKTPGQVELLDAMGRVLRNKKIARTGHVKLDVADLPDGIYFLKMTTETGSVVRRVVVF